MVKIKEEDLLENKDVRKEYVGKLEVLEKVKGLLLLPNTELMTTKSVAEYFEVNPKTVSKIIDRNREELTSNGLVFKKYGEIKELINSDIMSQLKISRQGTNIFSKRAVLNVAMLLRDSKIAQRIRTALLDQQEAMSNEQKVKGITDEEVLLLNIVKGKDVTEIAVRLAEYNNYKNRHIAELNATIKAQEPKAEAFDDFINAKNNQGFNEVAKTLGVGHKKLMAFLREKKVLMKTSNSNIPYQSFIDRGLFIVKESTISKGEYNINCATTYVTPKGINTINKLIKKSGVDLT